MKRKKILWISLVAILIFSILYTVFVFRLPQLIRISQKLGIELSWDAFHEYLEQDLIGMTRTDVHALLKELYPNIIIQQLDYIPPCDREHMEVRDVFMYFSYLLCYEDDTLVSVELIT